MGLGDFSGTPKAHKHKHFTGIRGLIWDIPILIFAYVPSGGPNFDFGEFGCSCKSLNSYRYYS